MQFDGRGNGYTSLFIDSQVAKWRLPPWTDEEKAALFQLEEIPFQVPGDAALVSFWIDRLLLWNFLLAAIWIAVLLAWTRFRLERSVD